MTAAAYMSPEQLAARVERLEAELRIARRASLNAIARADDLERRLEEVEADALASRDALLAVLRTREAA